MTLDQYQKLATKFDQRKNKDNYDGFIPLLGLIGEIGSVAAEFKKKTRDGISYITFSTKFKEELGDVLWYVAMLSKDANFSLDEVAKANLQKIEERWAKATDFKELDLYDNNYDANERLPRELTIEFREVISEKRIGLFFNDTPLGNTLTDNAHIDDGYRFHDSFHLAYMAILGWSPVMRKLLNRKRKSSPQIDEVEDGARAMIIEEAISAFAYEYSKSHNFFEGIEKLDYEFLKTIKNMVMNFEVKSMPSSLWEKAVLDGYEVFRQLKDNGGGKVYLNLEKRTIKFLC